MTTAVEQIDEINRRVRLLPWKDRALWHRVVAVAVESGPPDQLFRIATRRFTAGPDLSEVEARHGRRPPPKAPDPESWAVPPSLHVLGWRFDFGDHQGQEAVSDFERHLVREVNPTLLSRWRNFLQTLSCLWRGPRPWSVAIRPTEMDFCLQIRHATKANIAWDEQGFCDRHETGSNAIHRTIDTRSALSNPADSGLGRDRR
jgi:hypothetical protein